MVSDSPEGSRDFRQEGGIDPTYSWRHTTKSDLVRFATLRGKSAWKETSGKCAELLQHCRPVAANGESDEHVSRLIQTEL